MLDFEPDFPRVMSLEGVIQALQATLQDERLAPLTRIGLARMQLPLVRQASAGVAAGLGDESHPALALVAHLVSCARGENGNAVSSSALAAEINRLVLVVEHGAQADGTAYQQAHAEFKAFLSHHQVTETAHEQKTHEVSQNVQKDVFTAKYTLLLRQMLHDTSIQPEVSDFLLKVWAEVLTFASVRYGHQHAQTLALQQAATALVWATGARKTRRNRARVTKDVPSLLQTLRDGMDLIGLTGDEKNRHITTLSTPMMDAFLNKKASHAAMSHQLQDAPERQAAQPKSVVRSKTARVSSLPGIEVTEDYPSSQGWHFWESVQAEQKELPKPVEVTDSTWSNPRGHREK